MTGAGTVMMATRATVTSAAALDSGTILVVVGELVAGQSSRSRGRGRTWSQFR